MIDDVSILEKAADLNDLIKSFGLSESNERTLRKAVTDYITMFIQDYSIKMASIVLGDILKI